MIVISIPVKPHVKKYLIKRYGESHTITKKTFLGVFISGLLHKKIEKQDYETNGFEKFNFSISTDFLYKKGHTISIHHKKYIGRCFEMLFFEDFYIFVDNELLKGSGNALKAVKLFLKSYNLTENELKLDSMYRNYQRYCGEKIKEKKKCLSKI